MTASTLQRLRDNGETVADPDEGVRGRKVLDNVGKKVGTIDGLMVDDDQNKVRFLQVECGGFLGIGATHVMIPVDAITSITGDTVTIDRTGEHLQSAPRYDPALVNTYDESYWGGVYGYYGYAPFWGMGYAYPPFPYLRHKPDAQITQDVEDELAWDPTVSVVGLSVTTTDGNVTLAGTTPTYASKWAATDAASRVGMVRTVTSMMVVDTAILGVQSDAAIATHIQEMLTLDGAVPAERVGVEVKAGVVTLTGSLDHFFQRQASEEDARKIIGVVDITNLITVAPIVPVPLDSKERITLAFRRGAEFTDDHLTVAISGSEVTLGGRVRTWSDHQQATQVAWRAPGVTAVTNNIRVTSLNT
jgi:osmotically-inducible protein OsmY/sporulation protein YlmC with PRC-barrel domain